MLRPWIELINSIRSGYGWRIAINNFRFELGALIGGFEHCDNYTDDEVVEEHRREIVQAIAERQAITS